MNGGDCMGNKETTQKPKLVSLEELLETRNIEMQGISPTNRDGMVPDRKGGWHTQGGVERQITERQETGKVSQ
jgi:hypothetical protein